MFSKALIFRLWCLAEQSAEMHTGPNYAFFSRIAETLFAYIGAKAEPHRLAYEARQAPVSDLPSELLRAVYGGGRRVTHSALTQACQMFGVAPGVTDTDAFNRIAWRALTYELICDACGPGQKFIFAMLDDDLGSARRELHAFASRICGLYLPQGQRVTEADVQTLFVESGPLPRVYGNHGLAKEINRIVHFAEGVKLEVHERA